jgi:4-hydroxy-tetrahydrodipicolinate synthase
MIPKLEGIIVPVLSPFTPDTDQLDVPALKRHVEWLTSTGISAVIANAGTSEFYHLDEAERRLEAEVVVQQVNGRLPVLVGAGAISTRETIRWAKHAESIGASGLLIMAPFYEPPSKNAILRHFLTISETVSLPIMLYNTVYVTQVMLTPEDVDLLASQANIPWVKLTTGVVEHIPVIQYRLGDRISIFEGIDTLAFPSMAMGAVGGVLGVGGAIPEYLVQMWHQLCVEKNLSAAQATHKRIAPLLDFLCHGGVYCSGIKEICRLRGFPLGRVRSPWDELNEEQLHQVYGFADSLGLV